MHKTRNQVLFHVSVVGIKGLQQLNTSSYEQNRLEMFRFSYKWEVVSSTEAVDCRVKVGSV